MRKNRTLKLIVIFVLAALGLKLSQQFQFQYQTLFVGLFSGILVITGFVYFVLGFKKK